MLKKLILFTIIISAVIPSALAQPTSDKSELERERQEIQNELKQIQNMYDKVKGQKKRSLGQLNMLKKKIQLQERYISSINRELKMIDDDIYLSNIEIYRLKKQLDTLKTEYARSVVYAYKNRSNYDYLNFIFSATSFNDAIRRISYLKSYRAYREKQVNSILQTQQLIAKRQEQQLGRKDQKNAALKSQVTERNELNEQRREKDAVVSDLKSQEKDLQKQIAAKKKRDRELQNSILAIVRRDIENAKREAARKAEEEKKIAAANPSRPAATTPAVTAPAKKPSSYLELNAKDIELGTDFGNSRGKLPWPVDNGFVSIPFGDYTIEGTKLKGNNPGITIATPTPGNPVKAVFEGVVAGVDTRGDIGSVFVRHGKYYTVYSNLSSVSVTKGAEIKRGQVIGRAGAADEGPGGQVDFMLMIESNNVNPASWLR